MPTRILNLALIAGFSCLAACHPKVPPSPLAHSNDYLELEAGNVLSVVIPLSKTGVLTSMVRGPVAAEQGQPVTVAAPADFAGYEKDLYLVESQPDGSLRVVFQRAEVTRDGTTSPQAQPIVTLFAFPPGTRHARLLYLVRVSESDHNMAVLAARQMDHLTKLTQAVQHNHPACVNTNVASCSWVPQGFAVRLESPSAKPK